MASSWRRLGGALAAVLFIAAIAACSGEPYALSAVGPFVEAGSGGPSLERVAVLVTVASRSSDDLQISPADFVARDADHRVYPANPTATVADARLVGALPDLRGALPLPALTLRGGDVLTGFVVFDVPAGARPTELVWRQGDGDRVVDLTARR